MVPELVTGRRIVSVGEIAVFTCAAAAAEFIRKVAGYWCWVSKSDEFQLELLGRSDRMRECRLLVPDARVWRVSA